MKQFELDAKLTELQAEYLAKKSSIELAINDYKIAIENLRKELTERSASIRSQY